LVKETRLEVYSFNGGKVFDSGAVGHQPIVWELQDQSGSAAPDGKYKCSFHYRNFTNPADKQKFDDCLTKGFEYIEKALALAPEYVDAISYKGLLCREKQKSSKDETERAQWAKEAQELASKGLALQRKKDGRQ
jgi:hypothetical protein